MSNRNTAEVIDQDTGEVLTGKDVAISKQAAAAVMINGAKFNVKRLVNVPTLKHESGETVCFRIDQPLYESESIQEQEVIVDGVKRMVTKINTVTVARVMELSSGQPHEYVCNAITADNLRSAYPDDSYVGKYFAVRKGNVVAGKRYKEVDIVEIEPAE